MIGPRSSRLELHLCEHYTLNAVESHCLTFNVGVREQRHKFGQAYAAVLEKRAVGMRHAGRSRLLHGFSDDHKRGLHHPRSSQPSCCCDVDSFEWSVSWSNLRQETGVEEVDGLEDCCLFGQVEYGQPKVSHC